MAAWNSFSYLCTRALHSFRSFAHWRAASTVIPLLPKATIQPNLCLPRTRPPLTSSINALLAIRYSSILSTCPNHLNTLWSALLANSLSIQALLRTSSFLTISIRDTPTKLLKHFISRTFTFLLSALLISHIPYQTHSPVCTTSLPSQPRVLYHLLIINSWFISNLPPFALSNSSTFPRTLIFFN